MQKVDHDSVRGLDNCSHPASVRQPSFVDAEPWRAIGQHHTVGAQSTYPCIGSHKPFDWGKAKVERFSKGFELKLCKA